MLKGTCLSCGKPVVVHDNGQVVRSCDHEGEGVSVDVKACCTGKSSVKGK
jgi:hypothetical protein